jgi:hypothetical protein
VLDGAAAGCRLLVLLARQAPVVLVHHLAVAFRHLVRSGQEELLLFDALELAPERVLELLRAIDDGGEQAGDFLRVGPGALALERLEVADHLIELAHVAALGGELVAQLTRVLQPLRRLAARLARVIEALAAAVATAATHGRALQAPAFLTAFTTLLALLTLTLSLLALLTLPLLALLTLPLLTLPLLTLALLTLPLLTLALLTLALLTLLPLALLALLTLALLTLALLTLALLTLALLTLALLSLLTLALLTLLTLALLALLALLTLLTLALFALLALLALALLPLTLLALLPLALLLTESALLVGALLLLHGLDAADEVAGAVERLLGFLVLR